MFPIFSKKRWAMAAVVGLAFCLMGGARAFAATYYVAVNGNDANDGSLASPFATIQRGVDAANAGDTVVVQDGTYGPNGAGNNSYPVNIDKAGNAGAPITLMAQNRWRAVLDCELQCHSYINLGSHAAWWVIENFDIRNGWGGGVWSNSGGGQDISIIGNDIHNIGNRSDTTTFGIDGIYTDAGARNFLIKDNVVHDVGRTNFYTNSFDHGIYAHGNVNIINNFFYNSRNGWDIQTALGYSGLIASNTFFGPNQWGNDGQIMLWDAGGDITIRNNVFYGSKNTALTSYSFSSPHCDISNNYIFDTGVTLGAPAGCVANNNLFGILPW